jgi:hypothetical protein
MACGKQPLYTSTAAVLYQIAAVSEETQMLKRPRALVLYNQL